MLNHITPSEKITILRLSAIGDVLMLLPAVRLLKKHYPNTEIDWLIDRPIASLLADVTEVNVIAIDKPRSIGDYWRLKQQWHNKNTGQLLSFQTSLRSNLISALLPAQHKTGFGKPYSREGHHFFMDTAYNLPIHLHQAEIFFALAKKFLGINADLKISRTDLELPINKADKAWAEQQLAGHKKWIAINPMASTQEKTWPLEHYIDLIKSLNTLYPEYNIVLTGGAGVKELEYSVCITNKTLCLNLVGQTTLTQLAATLKHVNLFISPDTGPLHLANAVGTPVIGLYAVTRLEYIGPYQQLKNCINVYNQAAQNFMQQSAATLDWQKNIPSLKAMQLITLDHVLAKVQSLNL